MADLVSESPPPIGSRPPAAALDRSLLRGIAWTGGAKWATQLLGWSSTLLVANLLGPDPYGLIGMASVFLGLVSTLTEFGLGTAIISLRKLSAEQNRQLNTIALGLGIVGALLTCAAAWPLGWAYREEQLPMIIVAMSSTFVLSALRIVPTAQLQRDLLFRKLAILETLQSVIFAAANVVFALLGFGVWTLVMGSVISQAVGTILTWVARPERFAWPRRDSLAGALSFSSHVLISRLGWYLYSNADFAVAGLVFGKSVLGAYTLAWQFASIPIDKISAMIARVTPAYFAAAQDDDPTMRSILLNITEALAFLTLPATFGLALVAPEFVRLILGPEWSAAIVPLQLLSIYASYRSLVTVLPQVLTVKGDTRWTMWLGVWTAIALPIGFLIGSRVGPGGIAAAWIIVYPLFTMPLYLRTFAAIGLTREPYLRVLWPSLRGALAMSAAVLAARVLLPQAMPNTLRTLALVVTGVVVYGRSPSGRS
ncbi:MAG: lipopolysaccharide biosynthesis protein [Gemmatimonadetes bacterium]|nr:lipopolysaccharide biosynthesis protein [Gemmatimonadota bacterium]